MYAQIGLDNTLFVEKKRHVYVTYVCRDRFRQYGTEWLQTCVVYT